MYRTGNRRCAPPVTVVLFSEAFHTWGVLGMILLFALLHSTLYGALGLLICGLLLFNPWLFLAGLATLRLYLLLFHIGADLFNRPQSQWRA